MHRTRLIGAGRGLGGSRDRRSGRVPDLDARHPLPLEVFQRRRRANDLEALLRTLLELQIREAQDRATAAEAAKRRDAMRAALGRLAFLLVLLFGYGLLLGLGSQTQVLGALLDPQSLARDMQEVVTGEHAAAAALTDAVQGALISAFTAFAVFVLRGTSTSVRADLGGVLFVGAVALSLVGISAAALTGMMGMVLAFVGFLVAGFLVIRLCVILMRLHDERPERHAGWARVQVERWSRLLAPTRHRLMAIVFIALPAFCLLAVGGAALTNGGPLYSPAFASRFVAIGWSLWAIIVTPAAARIPLWSMPGWGTLVVLQLSEHPASFAFLLAAAAVLAGATVWLVFARPHPRDGTRDSLQVPSVTP